MSKVISLAKNKIVSNTGIKYSTLLENFMLPFAMDFNDFESAEDIFDFSIKAWNIANIHNNLRKEDIENAMDALQLQNGNISLLKRMIAHKNTEFKDFSNFIVDYEFEDLPGKDPILSVITQDENDFLSEMMVNNEYEVSQDDFRENFINRTAIIIHPQQPFLDWYSNLNPTTNNEKEIQKSQIYLVDDTIEDIEKWLQKKFDKLFMMELNEWHSNKKEWPQRRNYKIFNQWFRVEISEMVYDLERTPVIKFE